MTSSPVKLISALRRKPNMTRKEFLDYHFQVHGSLSDVGTPELKPFKYRQYHIFDSAFGERLVEQGPPNKNHFWVGRDDVTELFFHDLEHLQKVFSCEHVKRNVGPDGVNFNDFETNIPWMGTEEDIPLPTEAAQLEPVQDDLTENGRCVAIYFVSTKTDPTMDARTVAKKMIPVFQQQLEKFASKDARGLTVNTSMTDSSFNVNDYFGGGSMPKYPVLLKVILKNTGSVAAIRAAQKAFEAELDAVVNRSESFIVFAKEGLVLDATRGISFDGSRQPRMEDLL